MIAMDSTGRGQQVVEGDVTISAGASEVVITPPVGAPTLGTIQRSTGVNDDLYARALVLNDGKQRIAILSLDLIGMDFVLSDEIRDCHSQRTGIGLRWFTALTIIPGPSTFPGACLVRAGLQARAKLGAMALLQNWQNWSLASRSESANL